MESYSCCCVCVYKILFIYLIKMKYILPAILVLIIAVVTWIANTLLYPGPPPPLDPNEWWGPETKSEQDNSIRPFKIKFTDEMISDLRARLKNHRPWPPALEGSAFTYGFNSGRLSWWMQTWSERYPFRQREEFLNSYPQYITNIQGLDIHFIRVKPQVPEGVPVVPLLMLHGWPMSVREFFEVIPLLTKQRDGYDFVFELIVPSLPGFGFSDAAVRPGLGPYQMSMIFKNLMNKLGYKKFYLHGGDWGAVTATSMATYFQDDILGYHSNFLYVLNGCSILKTLFGSIFPSLIVEPHLASRIYPLSSYISFLLQESGYFHLQATKPDSVGISLSESPLSLLAYTFEKISVGTNRTYKHLEDGGLTLNYTEEQLLDNLMIYWMTNSVLTSLRIYAEYFSINNFMMRLDKYYSSVPTWGLQTKYEIIYQPANILKCKFTNLLGLTALDRGGHFAAMEMPEEFAADVFKAVEVFKSFHKGKSL